LKINLYHYSLAFPVYIEFGHHRLLLHSLAEILAFTIGFKYFQILKRKEGDQLSGTNRSWVFVGAIFGALIGSRLLGGFENPTQIKVAGNLLLYFYQNKTVVGGFLGGLAGVEIVKKCIGETKSSGDLFVQPILLALIIGRIGCFSMGIFEETYGIPTAMPWGMDLGDGLKRHPVDLYEIIFLIVLWIIIRRIKIKYELRSGTYFKIFMITYLLFRFLLDFIKPHINIIGNLSMIQLACLTGLLYYRRDMIFPQKMIVKPQIKNA
jgi:phosphatidylglycerol---prolipoprotein diacylglyceryl transferase